VASSAVGGDEIRLDLQCQDHPAAEGLRISRTSRIGNYVFVNSHVSCREMTVSLIPYVHAALCLPVARIAPAASASQHAWALFLHSPMDVVKSNLFQPIIFRSLLTFHPMPRCFHSACAQDTAWWWRLPGHGGPGLFSQWHG
jgi:hypothetical protein